MSNPARATIVTHALQMDRIAVGQWFKKTGESESGDTHAAAVSVKVRRVKPTYSIIQAFKALLENGGCVWQVIDETGALLAGGYDSPGGYLLIGGTRWNIDRVDPTAAEVLLLTGCYRENL